MSTPVFTFEWDLSGGALSSIVRHVGILVFGTFYEFCKEGIVKTKVLPGCLPPSPEGGTPLEEFGVELGRTTKTEAEFNNWISSESASRFKALNYDAVTHNCIKFAGIICTFLGVDRPLRWSVARGIIAGLPYISYPVAAISALSSSQGSSRKK